MFSRSKVQRTADSISQTREESSQSHGVGVPGLAVVGRVSYNVTALKGGSRAIESGRVVIPGFPR